MTHPNILFILCDDLAPGDLSCLGNPYFQTPRLDALAAESARVTRCCSGPLCTPARAALFTGRHPYRTAAVDTYIGRSMLHPDEITLPQLLKTVGYQTGLFGKWHLGDCYPLRPCDRGFDESLWHRGGGLRQFANPGHCDGRDGYFDPLLTRGGDLVESRGYCTDIFTDAALEWIRARPAGKPWFAYVAYNAPHTPLEIGEEWLVRHQDLPQQWQKLYGMVANIDHNVGRLLDAVPRDTLVVFTSDHGPCPSAAFEGRSRWNGGRRSWKGAMYEGGVNVPCFVRWTGQIPPGDVNALMNPIDWLPTFAAACGFALPTDRAIDGVNLLPVLRRQAAPPDRAIVMQWHRGDVPQRFRNAAVITPRWKWYRTDPLAPDELYDLPADPTESRNLAANHPELCAQFAAQYERWFEDVSITRPNNFAPPRIIIGHPAAPVTHLTLQDARLLGTWEGWGTTFPAYWLVDVHQAGDYEFNLHLGDSPVGLTWTLRCGESVTRVTMNQRQQRVTLRLQRGPQSITCLTHVKCTDLYPNQPDPGARTIAEIRIAPLR